MYLSLLLRVTLLQSVTIPSKQKSVISTEALRAAKGEAEKPAVAFPLLAHQSWDYFRIARKRPLAGFSRLGNWTGHLLCEDEILPRIGFSHFLEDLVSVS